MLKSLKKYILIATFRELYACVKNSKLGDCLPVIYTNESTKKHQRLMKYKQLLSEGEENELGNLRDSQTKRDNPETVSSEEITSSSEVTESVGDMEGHESDSELEEHSDTGNFSAKPGTILT